MLQTKIKNLELFFSCNNIKSIIHLTSFQIIFQHSNQKNKPQILEPKTSFWSWSIFNTEIKTFIKTRLLLSILKNKIVFHRLPVLLKIFSRRLVYENNCLCRFFFQNNSLFKYTSAIRTNVSSLLCLLIKHK